MTILGLITGRDNLSAIIVNTTLYVVGGEDGAGFPLYSVEKATIFPDGQLSAFTTVNADLDAPDGGGLYYDGTYLNAVGGGDSVTERALINPDGSLGNWELTSGLQMWDGGFGVVQNSSAAYVIGGYPGGNAVEYAPLVPTGIEKREWEIFE